MALSDIEIAQAAKMERINKIAQKLGIPEEHLVPYGHYKTKVSLEYVDSLKDKRDGMERLPVDKLITHRLTLDQINEGFDRLDSGEAVRQVILFD